MGKWTTKIFELHPEDLKDNRWGDWITQHGPFIVTQKGVFTDCVSAVSFTEMFFYYCPWEYSPGIITRKEYDSGYRIKARLAPLFLQNEVHPELPFLSCHEYKKYKEDFQAAVDVAWEFAKKYV